MDEANRPLRAGRDKEGGRWAGATGAKDGTHQVHRRTKQRDRNHRGKQRRVKVCMAAPRSGGGGAVCTLGGDACAKDPSEGHGYMVVVHTWKFKRARNTRVDELT